MINLLDETVISLQDAAALCPKRHGKKPHISCLYRWTTSGCKGQVLEFLQVGGSRCTSKEALARFFQRLTDRVPTVSRQNERAHADTPNEVDKQLDSLGM